MENMTARKPHPEYMLAESDFQADRAGVVDLTAFCCYFTP
jgi:hypothetical protein